MNLAVLSLLALLGAVVAGTLLRVNIGLLSIALAFAIGVLLGGMTVREVTAGFPVNLFLTLVAVTLLFSQAQVNGTLERISALSVRLTHGRTGFVPLMFFGLALLLASIGPGNIAATALLAPVAMNAAARAGIPAFLMALMVCNGANAGAFSPFAPTGIIANGLMAQIGLAGYEWRTYLNTLLPQAAIAAVGYLLFGGARLLLRGGAVLERAGADERRLGWRQWATLLAIGALVASVVLLKVDVMIGAFVAATLLALAHAGDAKEALARMPWDTILLVCGVTVLLGLVDRTGGMDLFAGLLAKLSTPDSVTAVMAFVTGAVSVYSSSSGVVLPAFLPTVPALIEELGGGDALAIAWSIDVGAHLVDVSPLSTLGALCIAAAQAEQRRERLFNQMLAWGLSMTLVGAAVAWLFFGVL
jgi:di/tricarboxylate transporter